MRARKKKKNAICASSDVKKDKTRQGWTNLVNVPVTELSWNLNLVGIFIHREVNVTAEPLKLHTVPLLVI